MAPEEFISDDEAEVAHEYLHDVGNAFWANDLNTLLRQEIA